MKKWFGMGENITHTGGTEVLSQVKSKFRCFWMKLWRCNGCPGLGTGSQTCVLLGDKGAAPIAKELVTCALDAVFYILTLNICLERQRNRPEKVSIHPGLVG